MLGGKSNLLPENRTLVVTQYQLVSPENTHILVTLYIQTDQVVFVYLGIYTHAQRNIDRCVTTTKEKKPWN